MNNMIYLDFNATTPLDPAVQAALFEALANDFANPAASSHLLGRKAAVQLEESRKAMASLIDASPEHLFFTSGASESNNTVLRMIADQFAGQKAHVLVSSIEHKCILNACLYLEDRGIEVTYLPVSKAGLVSVGDLKAALRPETKLISIMAANNETGVFQPIKAIAEIAKAADILFHVDAAQVVGKYPFSLKDVHVDFLSFSGHKFYAPKGVGGLFCRCPEILEASPLIYGGGQELGVRGGTSNLPSIIAMAKAADISKERAAQDHEIHFQMKQNFIAFMKENVAGFQVNGDEKNALPNTINFYIEGVSSKELLKQLKNEVALGTGSACSSEDRRASHVLKAMGLSDELAESSIRLSFGRSTTADELMAVAQKISGLI